MKKHMREEMKIFSPIQFCPEQGKPIYDKRGAQTAANLRMRSDHMKLRIYHCESCNGWHLTKHMRFNGNKT